MSEINLKYVHDLEWQNANFRVRIAALEEAGDGLANWRVRKNHYHQYTCELCDCYADTIAEITHDPDCPVTKWQEAKG